MARAGPRGLRRGCVQPFTHDGHLFPFWHRDHICPECKQVAQDPPPCLIDLLRKTNSATDHAKPFRLMSCCYTEHPFAYPTCTDEAIVHGVHGLSWMREILTVICTNAMLRRDCHTCGGLRDDGVDLSKIGP